MSWFLKPGEVEVLGITAPAGGGKDYMAQIASRYGFLPLALAQHFKVTIAARGTDDLPAEEADIRQLFGLDPKDIRHRRVLQLEGTERGRDLYGPDIWCRHAEAWMFYFASKGVERFVIPDVRFLNEADWIHALGGKVYQLHGRGGMSAELEAHRSEQERALIPCDRSIDNRVGRDQIAVWEFEQAICYDFPSTLR